MIPLNLLRGGRKADYIVTGNWAEKAYKEAKLVGGENVRVEVAVSVPEGVYGVYAGVSSRELHEAMSERPAPSSKI